MKRKAVAILMSIALGAMAFTGCGTGNNEAAPEEVTAETEAEAETQSEAEEESVTEEETAQTEDTNIKISDKVKALAYLNIDEE